MHCCRNIYKTTAKRKFNAGIHLVLIRKNTTEEEKADILDVKVKNKTYNNLYIICPQRSVNYY